MEHPHRFKVFLNLFSVFAFLAAAIIWWRQHQLIGIGLIICSIFYAIRTFRFLGLAPKRRLLPR